MKSPQTQTVSVIIPCYNEGVRLGACLKALSLQTVPPLEVIVVDNNSTDDTVAIAQTFSFVSVMHEKEQGLIAARNAGFTSAKGTVLARIDADTHVAENWVETLITIMNDHPNMQAVTGTGYFYDAYLKRFSRIFRNFFAVWVNRLVLGHHMLWGSNMAIRTSAWQKVGPLTCHQKNIMEDLDIAIHTNKLFGHGSVRYYPSLWADISLGRVTAGLVSNYYYMKMWPRTLRMHKKPLFLISWLVITLFAFLSPLFSFVVTAYDEKKDALILLPHKWRKDKFDRGNP